MLVKGEKKWREEVHVDFVLGESLQCTSSSKSPLSLFVMVESERIKTKQIDQTEYTGATIRSVI